MKINLIKYLYVITIIFFALAFVNIMFAWLGFACMVLPFILLAINKKKVWCSKYCPRASLFSAFLKGKSLTGKSGPKWLIKSRGKWIMLVYFMFNLFVLTMSTIMVFSGKRPPMDRIRFMIAFQLPWDIPQLLNLPMFPDWAVHLSFRVYSMMLTTTVLGLLLGILFLPRTWCTVCPINTVSDIALKDRKKSGYN